MQHPSGMQHPSRLRSTLTVLVASVFSAAYPKVAAAPQTPAKDNIKVQASEVVIDAIVTDRHNRMVTNLNIGDFVIYEDGVRQNVTSFHLHEGVPAPLPEAEKSTPHPRAPAASPTPPQAAPAEPPGLAILLLDYSTVEMQNQKLVREASAKYVRNRMQPNDRIAVFTLGSSLHPLTNFTDDRDAILAALKTTDVRGTAVALERADLNEGIAKASTPSLAGVSQPAVTSGPGAAGAGAGMGYSGSAAAETMAFTRISAQYAALRSALDRDQTREVLLAIQAIAQGVKHIEGRKSLLLFSQGFVISQILWPELQATVDAANRAQLAIYSIDAHGLETRALSGSLVPRDEFTKALGPSENERNRLAQQERKQATAGEDMFDRVSQVGHDLPESALRYLANTTGGFLIYNTNDPSTGLARISEETRTYYTLSYKPTNQNFDGKFRQIKVELKVPQLSVRARGGYYAMPAGFESLSPEEYQLVAQWKAGESATTHVPVYVRAGGFREGGTDYRVPVILEIPTPEVRFEKHGATNQARFQILGLVRDSHNILTTRFGGRTQFTDTNAEYEVLSAGNISFVETLYLPEGNAYSFEVLVKDLLSGKVLHGQYGIYLRDADSELALSTVLLAKDAEKKAGSSGQFLSVGDIKILPSARCQFKNGDNLIFYFDVYNPQLQADKKSDLSLEVFLMRGGNLVDLKLPAYRLSEPVNETLPRVTVARYVQLAGLSAGDYSLVVNVRDRVAGKSQSAHAPFTVVN